MKVLQGSTGGQQSNTIYPFKRKPVWSGAAKAYPTIPIRTPMF